MKEALKLALEALESSDKLINGSGNHFGLEGAMDGYYSGCFDVDGNNKLLNEAITATKEALAKQEQGEPDYKTLAIQLQQQRTWVGLTDEDTQEIYLQNHAAWQEFAKAIEAKLKAKNFAEEKNT
jgi:hypothetical protein